MIEDKVFERIYIRKTKHFFYVPSGERSGYPLLQF